MDQNHTLTSVLIALLFLIGFSVAQHVEYQNDDIIPPSIVQPAPDIEFLWEIEDTRSESPLPLVTYLENNGSPLGYDEQSNTFYCTLGMNTSGDWPEISLIAPTRADISICFADDYTYDWCDQAIADGYAYELIAYTDTEYAYFSLVFTGLPVVSLHTKQEISTEYIPAYASISSAEHSPVQSLAKTHIRGSAFHADDQKKSYRLEFHRINQQGKDKKNSISLLGMPNDTDWLLISNYTDDSLVRNHLAWDMWKKWNSDNDVFSLLESRMVEVFVNNEYMGLYQLMQRIDTDVEVTRMGGNLDTDCAFRILAPANIKDRLVKSFKDTADVNIEIRKPPSRYTEEGSFTILDAYSKLADVKQGLLDDDAFLRELESHMDIEDLLSYFLYSQAISTHEDNVYNNLYIWAMYDGTRHRYWYAPWDLDLSFALSHAQANRPLLEGQDDICSELHIPVRLLNLGGLNSRQILWELWTEKRSTILSDNSIYQWLYDAEHLVNASGAYARNSEKWTGSADNLNISEICAYAIQHLNTLDRFMRECWPYGDYTPDGL